MCTEEMRAGSVVLFLLVGLLLVSCEHLALEDPEPPMEATLAAVQSQIFNQSCALSGCHVGAGAAGLSLEEGKAYDNLVGVPSQQVTTMLLVEPGNPDASYLVTKVEGGDGMVGTLMPLGRPPLSADEIQLIRDWILSGAMPD